jgi:hypothetical protein
MFVKKLAWNQEFLKEYTLLCDRELKLMLMCMETTENMCCRDNNNITHGTTGTGIWTCVDWILLIELSTTHCSNSNRPAYVDVKLQLSCSRHSSAQDGRDVCYLTKDDWNLKDFIPLAPYTRILQVTHSIPDVNTQHPEVSGHFFPLIPGKHKNSTSII